MPLSGFLVKMALLTNFWNLSESVHSSCSLPISPFIFVASYIELPFMILPIFNVLDDMDNNLINASYDLGATKWETFRHVIFPLSMNGVRSGVQSVFIPSLSLFMLTRLIGGNRVITLGTAIEQNFLTNDNYGMGSTIGVILILTMFITMWVTKERRER